MLQNDVTKFMKGDCCTYDIHDGHVMNLFYFLPSAPTNEDVIATASQPLCVLFHIHRFALVIYI